MREEAFFCVCGMGLTASISSALLLFSFLVHEQDNEADGENDAQGQEDGHRRTSKGKGWQAAGLYEQRSASRKQ